MILRPAGIEGNGDRGDLLHEALIRLNAASANAWYVATGELEPLDGCLSVILLLARAKMFIKLAA